MIRFLILSLATALTLAAADEKITLSNGVQVIITTSLGHPTGTTTISPSMVRASGDSFYRIFRDQNQLAVFAYELSFDRSGTGKFVVGARRAMTEFASRFPDANGGKPVPSFSSDQSFTLDSGQTATIPVFSLEGQGLDVIDTVEFVFDTSRQGSSSATEAIQFSNLRVSIDGTGATPPNRTVSGRYAMFYIPQRGAFFFSTGPAPGFLKSGSIQGAKMQFTVDNQLYDCTSALPISQSPELWVLHNASYRPTGDWTKEDPAESGASANEFFTAASDSLDWWLQ
jgi:hypothetical protein